MRRMWVLCAAVAAVTLGGCGDDEPADSSAGAASGGEPIKVMVVSSKDSQVYNYPGVWEVAKAYVGDLNERGGINGRPIEIVECNDRADPNLSERCARDATSDEDVVALVGGLSGFDARIIPLLEQAKIPWVGSNPLSPQAYTSEMTFTGNPVPFTYIAGAMEAAKCSNPVATVSEGPSVALYEAFDVLGLKAEDADRDWAKYVTIPIEATDISPYVADLTEGSPDCIWSHLHVAQQQKLLPELAKLDNPPKYFVSTTALSQEVLDAAPEVIEGAVIGAGFPAPTDPLWDDAKAAIEKHANPKIAHLSDGPDASSWVAFKIFEEVVKAIDGEVNRASVLEALNSASAVDTGGLTGPIDYSTPFEVEEFSRLQNRSAFLWTVKDGELETMDGPTDLSSTFVKGYQNTH